VIATRPGTIPVGMSAIVSSVVYRNGRRAGDVDLDDIAGALREPEGFVWIGLYEPSKEVLRSVQAALGLHDLAVEDAHRAHQRPKLEIYGESVFVVVRTVQMDSSGARVVFGETHFFVGPRYLVSVRHGSSLSYADVRARAEASPQLLVKGPGYVLYMLMDFIVDQYFPVIDRLTEELQATEERVFRDAFSRETTSQFHDLRRQLLAIKSAISPLIDICNRLMRFDLGLVPEDTRLYFRDVYDHAIRLNEMVDTLRELLSSAIEAGLAYVSIEQNEAMKRFAGWAAILAVPTMVAGVYGMNFEFMPELHWRFGYPTVVGATFGLCVFLYVRFKRANWL
jgi:magnesium transporter